MRRAASQPVLPGPFAQYNFTPDRVNGASPFLDVMVYSRRMSRAALVVVIAVIGCSSKASKPLTPCEKYGALKVSCRHFTRTLEIETQRCEEFSKMSESELDLKARSDVELVPRIREAHHGETCAITVTDCAAFEACMAAATDHDPPLPTLPDEASPQENSPPPRTL